MAKYRPIPRTLSDAVLRVVTGPLDPSYLVSPDQLMTQVPLLEPKILFQQTQPRTEVSSQEPSVRRPTDLKAPEQLFVHSEGLPYSHRGATGDKLLSSPSSLKNKSLKKKN